MSPLVNKMQGKMYVSMIYKHSITIRYGNMSFIYMVGVNKWDLEYSHIVNKQFK